jgi:hypothetical protein
MLVEVAFLHESAVQANVTAMMKLVVRMTANDKSSATRLSERNGCKREHVAGFAAENG